MTPRRAWMVLLLLGATACGPETASSIKLASQPVDVVFGAPTPTATAAPVVIVPGGNYNPPFPSLIEPPPPLDTSKPPVALPTPTATPAPPTPCPTEALPGIKLEAPPRATVKPQPASYTFLGKGTAQRTLPAGPSVQFDGLVTRTYSESRAADATQYGAGAFTYDVTETSGTSTVVNTYLISPNGGAVTAGFYLAQVQSSTGAGGGTNVFAPTTPVELMPFPAQEQTTFHGAGTDPRSQTSMALNGTVVGKKRLNFCGVGVDSWEVELNGQLASPVSVTNVTDLLLDVATQYGGVIMHDELSQNGTDTGGQFTSTRTNSITREPDARR